MAASREIIAKTITSAVKDRFKNDPDSLTVNSIRVEVEERLDLDKGYLKSDVFWKDESKKLVQTTVEKLTAEADDNTAGSDTGKEDEEEDEDVVPSRPTPKSRKPVRRTAPSDDESEFDQSPPPPKKRKTTANAEKPKSKPDPKRKATTPATVESSSSELSEVDEQELLTPEPEEKKQEKIKQEAKESPRKERIEAIFNSSDLSEVEDAPPVPRKKRESKGEGKATEKAPKKEKAKAKRAAKERKGKGAAESLTPAEQKIKTLQNHLLKCGIRRIWSKELAQYSKSKEKIQHLEGVLRDIGMTGRFSLEKAKAIKERRELEEEVAAVQEGAKDWGRNRGRLQTRASLNAEKSASKPPPTNQALDDIDFLVDRSDSD